MIHIVFNTADIAALEQAIELDESLSGKIIEIKDDYAVGPLSDIYETEGYQARRDWWKDVLAHSPYEDQLNIVDDKLTVHHLINALTNDENEMIWIWMGQNAHDVSGYYWLMSQFKEYQSRIHVLYLNNLPFLNEKGQLFYPTHLSQIQPKEFLKAKKLARPITLSEFELDPDEWKKLCQENEGVRLAKYEMKAGEQWERDHDFVLIRYSEILMMQAECYVRLGSPDLARPFVQQVAARAGEELPATIDLAFINQELLKEFT